jgi:hypothetical protein
MGITVETTPNRRAMKFNVGTSVGATSTATGVHDADERIAPLFEIEGVMSVFMTADFVTVSRTEESSWETITPAATEILCLAFG